jgi:hypothetical protein
LGDLAAAANMTMAVPAAAKTTYRWQYLAEAPHFFRAPLRVLSSVWRPPRAGTACSTETQQTVDIWAEG